MKNRKFGKAQVEVSIRDQVAAGLKGVERKLRGFGTKVGNIGKAVAGTGAAISGVSASILAPLTASVRSFVAVGDAIQKTTIRTGLAAEQLTSLGFAAEQSGATMEQLATALQRANRRVANAATATGPAVRALKELGLEAKQLSQLNTEDRFLALADALNGVENEFRRNQLAFEIFGDSSKQLVPLLAEGSKGIRALQQEAKDLGITFSDIDANNAAKLGDVFNRISRTISASFQKIGAAVVEPLIKVGGIVVRITSAVGKWIDANRGVVRTVAAVAAGLAIVGPVVAAAGVAIVGLGATIASIGTIASTAFAAASAAIGLLTSPIALAAAGIAAIGYATVNAVGGIDKLKAAFGVFGETAKTAWDGIVAAISSGDFELAGKIAFTTLEIGWLQVTSTLKQVWADVADFLRNIWLNVVESIVQIGANIYFGVAKQFDQLAVTLRGAFDTAFTYVRGMIDSIQTAIAKAIIKAQEFFGLFSAEQSQQIQGTLDADLARRATGRQTGLEGRATARQAELDQRAAARRQSAEQFSGIVADEFNRRRSKSTVDRSGIAAAQERLLKLQEQLTKKATEAQQKQAEVIDAQKAARVTDPLAAIPGLASQAGARAAKIESMGTSSAAAIANGFFGSGRDNNQQETAQNTRKLVGQMQKILLRKQAGFG